MGFKLLHIIGARPHFMKLAPVYAALERTGYFEQKIVHSGQHYDKALSTDFIEEFDLPVPDFHLKVGSGTQSAQIGKVLIALDAIINEESPDIVFVYGDTNTTAGGAICAAANNVPVAHVEAGLREWDKLIPEERNKLLTDAISDILFCPTQTAVENLKQFDSNGEVHLVGDVVVDLLLGDHNKLSKAVLEEFDLDAGDYHFVTCHRAANTDEPGNMAEILQGLASLDRKVIFPVHPRTAGSIQRFGLSRLLDNPNLVTTEPLGFWKTQTLIANARAVITDSGGVIKEAYIHKRPCIIIDRQTEWVEAVKEKWAHVTGPDARAIVQAVNANSAGLEQSGFLGDGRASERIADITRKFLEEYSGKDLNNGFYE